ncbi:hypothetical protein P4O66_021693, partial [Electrophorus voltai]
RSFVFWNQTLRTLKKMRGQFDKMTFVHMLNNIVKNSYGHYELPQPFKERQKLPARFFIALCRWESPLSPTKVTIIPRLELTATDISVKMSDILRKEW